MNEMIRARNFLIGLVVACYTSVLISCPSSVSRSMSEISREWRDIRSLCS